MLLWASAAADGRERPWRYAIGEPRVGQQGNFCLTEKDMLEIAWIFEKFSPRAGYAALANAPNCSTRIESFTPRRVVKRITIAAGEPAEYLLSFVEVVTAEGAIRYLVTTREVRE